MKPTVCRGGRCVNPPAQALTGGTFRGFFAARKPGAFAAKPKESRRSPHRKHPMTGPGFSRKESLPGGANSKPPCPAAAISPGRNTFLCIVLSLWPVSRRSIPLGRTGCAPRGTVRAFSRSHPGIEPGRNKGGRRQPGSRPLCGQARAKSAGCGRDAFGQYLTQNRARACLRAATHRQARPQTLCGRAHTREVSL